MAAKIPDIGAKRGVGSNHGAPMIHMVSLEPDFCEDCDKTGGGPRQYTIK